MAKARGEVEQERTNPSHREEDGGKEQESLIRRYKDNKRQIKMTAYLAFCGQKVLLLHLDKVDVGD